MICDELGLIGKEMVAVDGSKFRASNSRLAYHSENKVKKKIEHYNKIVEKYLLLLDQCDNDEINNTGINLSREEIKSKIEGINKRLSELEVIKEYVKENGSIYVTDPDSRMMKTNNNGVCGTSRKTNFIKACLAIKTGKGMLYSRDLFRNYFSMWNGF